MKTIVTFISILLLTQAIFENTSVQELDEDDFVSKITNTDDLWVVIFYNNSLDDDLVKAVEQTALSLRNMVNVGAINDLTLASSLKIRTFPAIKIFSIQRDSPISYEGKSTAESLVNSVFDTLITYTFERIGAKQPKKKVVEQKVEEVESEDNNIIILDDETYTQIQNSTDAWMVEFFAPWCDHCVKLEPDWIKLGKLLEGEVKVAKIDSEKNKKAHEKFKVKGYPSIKFFPAGEKLDGEWEEYDGSREANSMASWARETNRKFRPIMLEQLLNHAQFKSNCLEYNGICVILFIPHIYDTGKEGREKYLRTFKDAILPHKQKPFNYFWSQGADQYDFEELFGLGGAGYPSVLAISPKKNVYSKMRASFSKDSVDRFIQNLVRGKEHVAPVRQALQIKTVEAWDGEDFKQN